MSDHAEQMRRVNKALEALSLKLQTKAINEDEYRARLNDLLEFANEQIIDNNTDSKLKTVVLKTVSITKFIQVAEQANSPVAKVLGWLSKRMVK